MAALVTVDAAPGNNNLRLLLVTPAGLYLRADTGALEAFGTLSNYLVDVDSTVVLVASLLSRYTFTVPVPAVVPVFLLATVLDIVTGDIVGSGEITIDADGNEAPHLIDGFPPSEALAIVAAGVAGELSGAQSGTTTVKGLDGSTTRIVATVDSQGNRSAMLYGDP